MEPLTMFASTVGFIGAIHLFSSAAERFGKGIYDKGNQQAERVDWYCFFETSELWGTARVDKEDKEQPTLTDAKRLEQRRRQQANRPRLQA